MTTVPKIEEYRKEFESYFDTNDVDSVFQFDKDPDSEGYCYIVITNYGVGIFSDNTKNKTLKMFIIKNSAINYANSEDLTEEQFSNFKSCVEIPTTQDFLHILSHPVQPELK